MTADKKTSYDEVPYPVNAFFQTHPANLEFIGGLFGMETVPCQKSRVLEIGCAAGGNLLPMAEQMPESEFVGVDYSQLQVDNANKLMEAAGITNAEFKCMNILEFGEDQGKFDYIIVHGIYSWVPDEVKAKILSICQVNLSPNGIAYVSYNIYPGWKFKGVLRDMILQHVAHLDKPADKIAQARALTKFLADAVKDQKTAYAKFLQKELEAMKGWKDNYLYHDTLEAINDPCYFYEFVARAENVGLQYLGDTALKSMLAQSLPEEPREVLKRLTSNLVEQEQYIDFLVNRQFRSSLLCHKTVALKRNIMPEGIARFAVGNAVLLHHTSDIDLSPGIPAEFKISNGRSITSVDPIVKAMLRLIIESSPKLIPFETIWKKALGLAKEHIAEEQIAARRSAALTLLFSLHCDQIIVLSKFAPECKATVSSKPVATPLARAQAANGLPIATRYHRSCEPDLIGRNVVVLLDGTRTKAAIVKSLVATAQTPDLVIRNNDEHITDPKLLKEYITIQVDKLLELFARNGLLIA